MFVVVVRTQPPLWGQITAEPVRPSFQRQRVPGRTTAGGVVMAIAPRDSSNPLGTDRLLFRSGCDVTAGQRVYGWTGPWPPPEVLVVVTAPLSRETAVTTPEAVQRVGALPPGWVAERFKLHHASAIENPAPPDELWFRGAEYVPEVYADPDSSPPGGTLGSDRPPLRGPAMTWTPDLRGDEPDALSSVVHQALGAASVCWEDMSGFDDRPPPAMIWTPDLRGDEPDALSSVVHQALGAASVCWEDMSGTGVFDDRRARDIGASLVAWIRGHHAAITSSGHGDYRDSETGQFVPREYAEGHPATTEHER